VKLILASTSPRRRELIRLFGLECSFASVDVNETPHKAEPAHELVERLSCDKANHAATNHGDALILAADTVVSLDGDILGKPMDLRDAERMLKALRGRDHLVFSGLCVRNNSQQWTQTVQTTVRMRNYTDAQIGYYLVTGNPLDKAAAYAIQHNEFRPVAAVDGCHANVMGLPLCHLYLALRRFGIEVNEPDTACQSQLQIKCPVARDILGR
jgi:septum formation protein